ncbi:N-terminal EF-hand calcium-binding protein 1 [Talpa occidentalis]|uniref:N-terminal EF-hand calcium-binding protein 1 n=1 Tax=Talpa occidentalis TaxID=50954 RepID=UPI0023F77BD0|nr:N-terminal EF-hand calcium-binding protein 1 [Talpa occidentalis]
MAARSPEERAYRASQGVAICCLPAGWLPLHNIRKSEDDVKDFKLAVSGSQGTLEGSLSWISTRLDLSTRPPELQSLHRGCNRVQNGPDGLNYSLLSQGCDLDWTEQGAGLTLQGSVLGKKSPLQRLNFQFPNSHIFSVTSSNNSTTRVSWPHELSQSLPVCDLVREWWRCQFRPEILRRADKNDDGKLSFEEFKAYFADGVLSGEELHELFHTIDTHNTNNSNTGGGISELYFNNLDTEELCEYFSQHLGEYENVLAALEDLNLSILKAMGKTKKDYQEASNLEQFVTRFLLKETLNQLQSLQNSLECAMETTEEQTRQERQGPTKPEVLSIQWPGKRTSRRVQRHNSFSPNSPQFTVSGPGLLEDDNQWMTQINRLQKLIDKLEKKDLKLEPLEEEVIEGNTKSHIMLVQRQMSVIEEDLEEFQLALKHYVESASSQSGCLRISIQKLSNESHR